MNICGCIVHVLPEKAAGIRPGLEEIEGVEVHAGTEDGRFVVVVEDTDTRRASEIIMDLHQIPGVISVTLTYHHFEEAALRAPARSNPIKAGDQPNDHF